LSADPRKDRRFLILCNLTADRNKNAGEFAEFGAPRGQGISAGGANSIRCDARSEYLCRANEALAVAP
jgi:hypothetical protein